MMKWWRAFINNKNGFFASSGDGNITEMQKNDIISLNQTISIELAYKVI